MLEFTRRCIALRSEYQALRTGAMEIREAGDALLVFDRWIAGQRLRCTFNLSEGATANERSGRTILSTGQIDGSTIGPYGAVIEEVA